MSYPSTHFPGTPLSTRLAVRRAMDRANVTKSHRDDWRVALEAMARYETNCNTPTTGSETCPGCRGMMQCAVGMYQAAKDQKFINKIDYSSRAQAVFAAILYIRSQLDGYGGYGTI